MGFSEDKRCISLSYASDSDLEKLWLSTNCERDNRADDVR